jgi:ribosomal protein S18 acetylase RimI-like enzyme
MSRVYDRSEIEDFLRTNQALHLYELGDLDDLFWPMTEWYGLRDGGRLSSLVLVYHGSGLPTLLALSERGGEDCRRLISEMAGRLPDRIYCHLSPGMEAALQGRYRLEGHGEHLKMRLDDSSALRSVDVSGVVPLGPDDLGELRNFYKRCYPGNWFDPRTLEAVRYAGLRKGGLLVSAAGVHVYSSRYRVAALGNIATDPAHRGRGLARTVTAGLCRRLLETVDTVGLNVKADNAAAVACYSGLGFVPHARYGEWTAEAAT